MVMLMVCPGALGIQIRTLANTPRAVSTMTLSETASRMDAAIRRRLSAARSSKNADALSSSGAKGL